jgi:hypothetical protein
VHGGRAVNSGRRIKKKKNKKAKEEKEVVFTACVFTASVFSYFKCGGFVYLMLQHKSFYCYIK